MKLDIKSFLIGSLVTINLFMLYGFTSADSDDSSGRYRISNLYGTSLVWYDTHTGEIIGLVGNDELRIFGGDNKLTYDEVIEKIETVE